MTRTAPTATREVRPSGAGRGTRMSAAERRDAIVAAATMEFATRGLVGGSTEAIARRVGVSQPYVFQLFGTKKELFLAVVRSCFGRTRLAFGEAARRWVPGTPGPCNSSLDAMADEYMELLKDRTLLLMQLQAYAACSDSDVRTVVREEFGRLHRWVEETSGASPEEVHTFFAEGMLLNVAAAVELPGKTDHWSLDALEERV